MADQTISEELALVLAKWATPLEEAPSIDSLMSIVMTIVSPLGYKAAASGLLGLEGPNALHFANWDPDWLKTYSAKKFIFFDPVPLWATRSGVAISVSDLRSMMPKNHPGHQIFAAGEQFGYFGGYIVPQRACDNSFGLVCFVGSHDPKTAQERLLLRGIAGSAFERAEILTGRSRPALLGAPVSISDKERECLRHLVRGKSAREVAGLMNVSEATVRFHISNLHRKMNVKQRSELVSLAITTSLVRMDQ